MRSPNPNRPDDLVLSKTADQITTLTLNLPARLNGWTLEMITALKSALLAPVWHTHAYADKARRRGVGELFAVRSGDAYGECALEPPDLAWGLRVIICILFAFLYVFMCFLFVCGSL